MSTNNQTDHFYNFNQNQVRNSYQANNLGQFFLDNNNSLLSSLNYSSNLSQYQSTSSQKLDDDLLINNKDEFDTKSLAKRQKLATNQMSCVTDSNMIYSATKQSYFMPEEVNYLSNYSYQTNYNNSFGATEADKIETVMIRKSKRDPIAEYDTELAESIEYELGLKKQNGPRKNSWGNLSYAELITRAIESSAEQRLTLSQIYDWIIKYVPYFKEKFDRTSSAGWKNSIRHNLSLHNRFIRVQNESSGKSSWWMINPDITKYALNPSSNSASNSSNSSTTSSNPKSPNSNEQEHVLNETNDNLLLNKTKLNESELIKSSIDLNSEIENNLIKMNPPNKKYRRSNNNNNNNQLSVNPNDLNQSTTTTQTITNYEDNNGLSHKQLDQQNNDNNNNSTTTTTNTNTSNSTTPTASIINNNNNNNKLKKNKLKSKPLKLNNNKAQKNKFNKIDSNNNVESELLLSSPNNNSNNNNKNKFCLTNSSTNNNTSLIDSPISTCPSSTSSSTSSPPTFSSSQYNQSNSILRTALQKSTNLILPNTPPTPTATPTLTQTTVNNYTNNYQTDYSSSYQNGLSQYPNQTYYQSDAYFANNQFKNKYNMMPPNIGANNTNNNQYFSAQYYYGHRANNSNNLTSPSSTSSTYDLNSNRSIAKTTSGQTLHPSSLSNTPASLILNPSGVNSSNTIQQTNSNLNSTSAFEDLNFTDLLNNQQTTNTNNSNNNSNEQSYNLQLNSTVQSAPIGCFYN